MRINAEQIKALGDLVDLLDNGDLVFDLKIEDTLANDPTYLVCHGRDKYRIETSGQIHKQDWHTLERH